MSRLSKILNDINDLNTENEVLSYWENRQERLLDAIRIAETDIDLATKIMYLIAKCLNDKEKYSSIYFLYKTGYLPIANKLTLSTDLNELKYELGRGLHHNRKYEYARNLFNELAQTDFDTSRFEDWWNQTAFASIRDTIWIKTDLLPALGRFVFMIVYILIVIKTKEFLISTTIFIILFELYETFWYKYRVTSYLKEYDDDSEIVKIKKNLKNKILIELGLSLLFYPIYFLKQEWLIPLVLILAIYFQVFHYGLNLYYLPKLIGELNRKKARHANNVYNS